jgi:hypothetical protein
MTIKKRELYEISGYNNEAAYGRFNQLTGMRLEFEIGQDYGTSCYDIMKFSPSEYPTLEELEHKIKNQLGQDDDCDMDFDEWRDGITESDIYNYLRRKGELPEADILFKISY